MIIKNENKQEIVLQEINSCLPFKIYGKVDNTNQFFESKGISDTIGTVIKRANAFGGVN